MEKSEEKRIENIRLDFISNTPFDERVGSRFYRVGMSETESYEVSDIQEGLSEDDPIGQS